METIGPIKGKGVAAIAYITIIGLAIAFVLNANRRTDFSSFHIRQATGLLLTSVVIWVAFTWVFHIYTLTKILEIGIFILGVIGVINALSGKRTVLPLVGESYEKMFASVD